MDAARLRSRTRRCAHGLQPVMGAPGNWEPCGGIRRQKEHEEALPCCQLCVFVASVSFAQDVPHRRGDAGRAEESSFHGRGRHPAVLSWYSPMTREEGGDG